MLTIWDAIEHLGRENVNVTDDELDSLRKKYADKPNPDDKDKK